MKICLQCSKELYVPPSWANFRRFCSASCRKLFNTPEQRFRRSVEKSAKCWLWAGCCNKQGYGVIKIGGKNYLAHRLSWEQQYGPIPENLCVCHHCDTPACVRPDHLFLGEQNDNMQDALQKDRLVRGEKHGQHKLTEPEVLEIWHLLSEGVSQANLGKQFSVSQMTISYIKRKQHWRKLLCDTV